MSLGKSKEEDDDIDEQDLEEVFMINKYFGIFPFVNFIL